MLIVPLDAANLFDLNAAILGWLLLAVQPRHNVQSKFKLLFLQLDTILTINVPVL
jgi:hypothetical protein